MKTGIAKTCILTYLFILLSGCQPESPAPPNGGGVHSIRALPGSSRVDADRIHAVTSNAISACAEGAREPCTVARGNICHEGIKTCTNGALGDCEPTEPSTDFQACGAGCRPCDRLRADHCDGGVCRCGKGPACGEDQQCLAGGMCARETSMSWRVDPGLSPEVPALPSIDGVFERPLAVLLPDEGHPVNLVADEIIIQTRERSRLADFLARTAGEILMELDPAGSELPPAFLVRVTPPPADTDALTADVRALVERDGYAAAWGHFRVSSHRCLGTIAIAAAEARMASPGFRVGLNFVPRPQAIPGSTREARKYGGGWHDAYTFAEFEWEGGLQTGVTQAWDLLQMTGRMENRVRLAILDMGFAPDADFGTTTGVSVVPLLQPFFQPNLMECSGGQACPWHGTNVASTAMARVDNNFGSAGVAGSVAEPIMVFTTYDFFMSIGALLAARREGADIANMSYSAPVPWAFAWSVYPFEAATSSLSRDMLIFASAGNQGRNVDSENACFIGCWEDTWHTPCENDGVVCVGGLNQHRGRHASSNYGHEHVNLYAPFRVRVGPDPEVMGSSEPDMIIQTKNGTSFSSPFAAGVAALVWAADPGLGAREVYELLRDNADLDSTYCCGDLSRVDARATVLDAIGRGLGIDIESPLSGGMLEWNSSNTFVAPVTLVGAPGRPLDVEISWESDVEGILATETLSCTRPFSHGVHPTCTSQVSLPLGMGEHRITVRATMGSEYSTASVFVTVHNSPPSEVDITQPDDGTSICHGQQVLLRGRAADPNGILGPENLSWYSDLDGVLGTGSPLMAGGLSNAEHVITLVATDDQGLTASADIGLRVLSDTHPDCLDRPPTARIVSPENGAFFLWEGWDGSQPFVNVTFTAQAEDAEDPTENLTIAWLSDRQGFLGQGGNLIVPVFMDFCGSTIHQVSLEVHDSAGNLATDQIRFTLQAPPC